jgi:hypothetical protein
MLEVQEGVALHRLVVIGGCFVGPFNFLSGGLPCVKRMFDLLCGSWSKLVCLPDYAQ